jgi:hypothetical protein
MSNQLILLNTSGTETDKKFWDDPENFAAVAEIPDGVGEPAVPIFSQGELVGNYKAVELFDRTPDGQGYPGTFADIVANTYVRATYQKLGGTAGQYGTSFAATFSYRPAAGDLQYVPTVDRADITIGGADRYTDVVTGHFEEVADTTSIRTFPEPTFGLTRVGISNTLAVQQNVKLAKGDVGKVGDVLRAGTLSSMFSSSQEFDASLILWEDKAGNVHSLQLSDDTPRDKHLFDEPQELGSWVELVKGAGSDWFPDSPTIRLVISDPHGLELGLQGFLVSSLNPNDDSLNVWTELLNPPKTIAKGTNYKVDFEIIAVPPLTDNKTYVTPFSAKLAGTPFSNVTLSGTEDINAIGNSNKNVLKGNSGDNTLDGGKGKDVLIGGKGQDSFSFNSPKEGVDTIKKFVPKDDTIVVSAKGFKGGLVAESVVPAEQFVLGSTATDSDDRFLYDKATGELFFDSDGSGVKQPVLFAVLTNKPTLTNADIFVGV